jgi:hypothetical protein
VWIAGVIDEAGLRLSIPISSEMQTHDNNKRFILDC